MEASKALGSEEGGTAPPTHNLLCSSALAHALLCRRDLGPQHRHAPEVARKGRDALPPAARRRLAVDGEKREPVDPQGLDGGAHLGRRLAVDGHEVDVRVVRGELPELGGQGAARRAGRDVKLEHRESGRGGGGGGEVARRRRRRKRPRDGGLEVFDRPRGPDVGRRGELVP